MLFMEMLKCINRGGLLERFYREHGLYYFFPYINAYMPNGIRGKGNDKIFMVSFIFNGNCAKG
jgi:hypothetical protein